MSASPSIPSSICKAGGITNWAKLGVKTFHPNYGYPHVWADATYDNHPTKSCIFCGRDSQDSSPIFVSMS